MFKISESSWTNFINEIFPNLGDDIVKRLTSEAVEINSEYAKRLEEKIKYDHSEKAVISESIAPAILNDGVMRGTFPNFDKIKKWVKYTKDGGKNADLPEYKINQIAYRVSKKIKEEGIEPTWFIDRTLAKMEGENG